MKIVCFFSIFGVLSLFGEMITVDNQTSYPTAAKTSTIKIQWAESPQRMNEKTVSSMYQMNIEQDTKSLIPGKNQLQVPSDQKYFRVLVWTSGDTSPTFVTSWVPVISDKTYTLHEQDLFYAVLTAGSGC